MKHLESCRFYNPVGNHQRYQRWCRHCAKRSQQGAPFAQMRCQLCGTAKYVSAEYLTNSQYAQCSLPCRGRRVLTGQW